jgi:hypothetical protein
VPTAAAPAVPGAAAASFAPQSFPQRAYSLIGAAAFGAVSMLVGVLVGARITRRATRARRP